MKDINFFIPDHIQIETAEGWKRMDRLGEGWEYVHNTDTASIQIKKTDRGIKILLTSSKIPVKTIALHWENEFENEVLIYGDAWERGYGNLQWSPIIAERNMPWYFLVDEKTTVSGIGVTTSPGAMISWYAAAERIAFVADTTVGSDGVELGDRTLELAEIVWDLNCEENVHDFAAGFAKKMCPNPKLVEQPIYGSNNWYYAYGSSTAEKIIEEGKLTSNLSENAENRPFVVIDDCWQQSRMENNPFHIGGPWTANPYFKDMEDIADKLRQNHVKPGIWFRPLLMNEPVKASWLLTENESGYVLDPTEPEVIDFIQSETAKISDWGYDLIKQDFSTFDILNRWGSHAHSYQFAAKDRHFKDKRYTNAEIVSRVYQAISKGAKGSVVIGCNTISHLSAGVFEVLRTGDDTSGNMWERTRRMGINTLAMRMHQHKAFYECDADCVGITEHIDWKFNSQWMDLLANSGTPLFISVDPKRVNKQQEKEIRKAFETASFKQKPAIPLDWQSNTCPAVWKCQSGEKKYKWNAELTEYSIDVWWR